MSLGTATIILITGYFIWKLYQAISKKPTFPADKIRLVSKETGAVLEMHLVKTPSKSAAGWSDDAFLVGAKFVFQKVSTAFATGNLKELKNALDIPVYRAFEQDILARKEKKYKMDFSLVCFDEVKILNKSAKNDEITVRFDTEQINLLKDEKDTLIEGDPMTISLMRDTWVFKKVGKQEWMITATQSRAVPCVK